MPVSDFFVIPALVFAYFCWHFRHRLRTILIGPPLLLVTIVLVGYAAYCVWYFHRPLPDPERRQLARGVTYARTIRSSPRPLVVHVVTIDLKQPGLEFCVTPAERAYDRQTRAQTTSQFVSNFHVQVAINASFFFPCYFKSPFDYYPRPGDLCTTCGECVSDGTKYSRPDAGFNALCISKDNHATIGAKVDGAWNAVSGREILLTDGAVNANLTNRDELMPETAVAIDRSGTTMYWIVVDGRQPDYSEGVTLTELAEICKEAGGWTAIALDGGGSSTLVAQSADSAPTVLNCPIHGRHPPGCQRPVANHLGLRVREN